jgi:uncharacterized low-complexity protein
MSSKSITQAVAKSACAVFAASLASVVVAGLGANTFAMAPVSGARLMLAEGKCGEGKCGMRRMDANGDGKVTKEEFMQGHEAMFDSMDANGDGVIDAGEHQGHHKRGKCRMQQDG